MQNQQPKTGVTNRQNCPVNNAYPRHLRLVEKNPVLSRQWHADVENAALLRGFAARIDGEIITPETRIASKLKRRMSAEQRKRSKRILNEICRPSP